MSYAIKLDDPEGPYYWTDAVDSPVEYGTWLGLGDASTWETWLDADVARHMLGRGGVVVNVEDEQDRQARAEREAEAARVFDLKVVYSWPGEREDDLYRWGGLIEADAISTLGEVVGEWGFPDEIHLTRAE